MSLPSGAALTSLDISIQSVAMFVLRTVTFRLQQSPKWLSSAGRTDEAVVALRKISHINGEPVAWTAEDVVDQTTASLSPRAGSLRPLSPTPTRASLGEYQGMEGGAPRASVAENDWGIASQLGTPQVDRGEEARKESPPGSPGEARSPEMLESAFRIEEAALARTEARRRRVEQGEGPTWVDRLPHAAGQSVDGYLARLDELFSAR